MPKTARSSQTDAATGGPRPSVRAVAAGCALAFAVGAAMAAQEQRDDVMEDVAGSRQAEVQSRCSELVPLPGSRVHEVPAFV